MAVDVRAEPRQVGPYTLVRRLGSGTFATTFEARHLLLGTTACVKLGHSADDAPLLLDEARLLWGFHHPSLPSLHDAFKLDDGRVALVMRYVAGQTLEAATPIDAAVAVQVLGRLLRALRVLHHRGIVHNDIKPANVLLEPDRHGVVLVDFGVSVREPHRASRAPGWTPAFAAPEVVAGAPPTPESDLYSLGLTVLSALGADLESRRLPVGVPEPLLQFLGRLTRRNPAERPHWDRQNPMRQLEQIIG